MQRPERTRPADNMRQRKVVGTGNAAESTAFALAQSGHTQASRCRSLNPNGKFLSVILVILFYTAAVSSACLTDSHHLLPCPTCLIERVAPFEASHQQRE